MQHHTVIGFGDRLFAILWFVILAPVLLLTLPTLVTVIVVATISLVFLAQLAFKVTWRCKNCGHFTRLGETRDMLHLMRSGRLSCHHCHSRDHNHKHSAKIA